MEGDCDVAVIGAGPAGSYAASLLASSGHRVLLLEQRSADAPAPRCTGVVGLPYVTMTGVDRDVIVNEASSATFFSPSGVRLRVSSSSVQACVLDRALLERRLRERAVLAGAELRQGLRVSHVSRSGHLMNLAGWSNGARQRFTCRALILAAGVAPGLARQLGVGLPGRFLVGAHAEVEMAGVPETEVYFMPDGSRGAFAWLVPVAERRVRVGVLCARSAAALTRRFLERPDIRKRLVRSFQPIAQRPVPVAALRRAHAAAVVAVGDAAGQVKPTTGGGLYFGAVGARIAADMVGRALQEDDLSARALSTHEPAWRSALGRELRHGALARSIYDRLTPGQVDRIIARAVRSGIADDLLDSSSFSFDRHSATLLAGLLRCLPGLLPLGAATSEAVRW